VAALDAAASEVAPDRHWGTTALSGLGSRTGEQFRFESRDFERRSNKLLLRWLNSAVDNHKMKTGRRHQMQSMLNLKIDAAREDPWGRKRDRNGLAILKFIF
jgi:hypothetical protein